MVKKIGLKIYELGRFAKTLGYHSAGDKLFKLHLSRLVADGKATVHKSGFASDSKQHSKIVILKAKIQFLKINSHKIKRFIQTVETSGKHVSVVIGNLRFDRSGGHISVFSLNHKPPIYLGDYYIRELQKALDAVKMPLTD